MKTSGFFLKKIIFYFALVLQSAYSHANSFQISEEGRKATLTIPISATISTDLIMREKITVMAISGLYETVTWDNLNRRFHDHKFIVRAIKDTPVPILFEVIKDQYSCSYNNPDWMNPLPDDVVNEGYDYSLAWAGGMTALGSSRSATVNANAAWLPLTGSSDKFIDLTLNITFPDISKHVTLMDKGGICQGSVTMLVSNKLN